MCLDKSIPIGSTWPSTTKSTTNDTSPVSHTVRSLKTIDEKLKEIKARTDAEHTREGALVRLKSIIERAKDDPPLAELLFEMVH